MLDPGGALITIGGMALAYLAGRATRRPKGQVQAICPCGHAISFHDDLVGLCRWTEWERVERKNHYEEVEVACRCQCYAGPELISSFTMRPITERPTTSEDDQ